MSASIGVVILTFSALSCSRVVSGELGRPTNVNLTSYNMNLVLSWDPPPGADGNMLYTTQYKTLSIYRLGCSNISLFECDFTDLNVSIIEYGKYTGRVRAQLGSEVSAWVESNPITPDKDTIIGSPDVSLLSNGATIDVLIKDPVFKVSALRKLYTDATYTITYWADGQKEKALSMSNIDQNRVVLDDLDHWTKYCVQVQIIRARKPISSEPSEPVCESTTSKEAAPWVAAVVTFSVMALAVALVVVTVAYHKRISHFLCPKDALPQHFKEMASPNYVVMQSTPPPEVYHPVTVEEQQLLEEPDELPLTA